MQLVGGCLVAVNHRCSLLLRPCRGCSGGQTKVSGGSVDGKVYCDTCRVKFETSLSEAVEGAGVKLICRDRVSEETKLEMEAETDKSGNYKFEVEGDHAEEICEVHLIKSPREDCNEIVKGWNSARILLTTDVGVVDSIRQANALGFMKKEALENCAKVLQDLGFLPIN
ncbi:hypothetical protein EZV62_014877 [Acer yangbiense]|uniref:Uncharacterized protein n=1 Tax=Acer yangbiense TaxID=1000413 RepID=A0A5C7HU26_9ROSI|nr:hypothetical protein EZV62_014877 [Acer yangbiense]